MMYMAGSSIQVYSLYTIYSLMSGAVRGMFGVNTAFAPFAAPLPTKAEPAKEPESGLLPKLAFVASQAVVLSLGLYKCHSMGLLPNESDWVSWKDIQTSPIQITHSKFL